NNDLCESCMGVGEFICCDSCPKVFHFSCCQPPVDSQSLPEEWWCNECHARKVGSAPPGIFKQLMDIVNRSNPREFVLPQEILSLTKEGSSYPPTR
ncbi:hypothetical protein B0O80DRAFT_394727, partial [Mortierella sp. GBAus27b]